MEIQIKTALRLFRSTKGEKRGILLTKWGCYYLHNEQYCTISCYSVDLHSPVEQILIGMTPCELFVGTAGDQLFFAAGDDDYCNISRLYVRFRIADSKLHGACFYNQTKACFAIFESPEARALLEALNADALHERKKREPCEALLSEFQQEKARENTEFLSVLREGNPEWFAEESAARSNRDASDFDDN